MSKRQTKWTVVCGIVVFGLLLGLSIVRPTSSAEPIHVSQPIQEELPETRPEVNSQSKHAMPATTQPTASGQAERTFTVKVARYVSGGKSIMAKSELSVRASVGFIEPAGTITVFFPSELWIDGHKRALVGKKIRVRGVLDLAKVDGVESNTVFATSVEEMK